MQIMKLLGIESVVITNAAGGVNDSWEVGTVCVVWDHVGLGSLVCLSFGGTGIAEEGCET